MNQQEEKMMTIKDLTTPALFLDTYRCKRNISRMVIKMADADCTFRPHFKTHQSAEVGTWFRDAGIKGITVSSTSMASYFISHGWTDVTIAFPFYPAMLPDLKKLQKEAALRLFVNSTDHLKLLDSTLHEPFSYYIEIDPGYGRSGIPYSEHTLIKDLVSAGETTPRATFHGFYIHDGRTYRCAGKKEVLETIQTSIDILLELKSAYPNAKISLGDTPSASLMDDMSFLDECTAGNFVFYDWTQVQIGSCTPDDVALFVRIPVAQIKKESRTAIVHAGAVHLSKDYVEIGTGKNFGQLVDHQQHEKPVVRDDYIRAISQEHGTIQPVSEHFNDEWITVIPAHSCLTANLHDSYITEDGKKIKKRVLS